MSLVANTLISFVTGSVSFTPRTILWALPWHIDPLISSDKFELLEVNLSVGGRRLGAPELASLKISVNISDAYIIVGIPVGAEGGSFQVGSSKFTRGWGDLVGGLQKASLKNKLHLSATSRSSFSIYPFSSVVYMVL